MKKKILAVLLASVLGIAAAGCGSNSGNDSSGSTDTQQEGVSKEAKSSAETVEVPEGESVSQDTDIVAAVMWTLQPLILWIPAILFPEIFRECLWTAFLDLTER